MISLLPYLDLRVPPQIEPLTMDEVKSALRVDGSEEDRMIGRYIKAARIIAEEYLCRSLITQTWQLQYDTSAPSVIPLPRGPVQKITEVKVIAQDWREQVTSESAYCLDAGKERLVFDTAPIGFIVQIQYLTGYVNRSAVPPEIKQGMLAHIAAMYETHGAARNMPDATTDFYDRFRLVKS